MRGYRSLGRATVVATIVGSLLLAACVPTAPMLAPPTQTSTSPATPAPVASPTVAPTIAAAEFTVGRLALVTDPQEVVPGARVAVAASITNVGSVAGTLLAQLTSNGVQVAQQEARFEAGEVKDLRFEFVAGAVGVYDVRLGPAQLALNVLGPAAFVVTAPTMTPSPAEVGDNVSVAVTVTNTGGLDGEALVELSFDGKASQERTVTVPGGASTDVTFSVPVAKPGKHVVTVNGQDAELTVWLIERPANGRIFTNKVKGGQGRLTVDNGNAQDVLMVLTRTAEPKKTVLSFYVRGGTTRAVSGIKDGTYIVYFRLGTNWDSHSRKFTRGVQSSRFKDPLPFKTTATTLPGWKLTLKPVVGGNAPSEDVPDEDFPKDEE